MGTEQVQERVWEGVMGRLELYRSHIVSVHTLQISCIMSGAKFASNATKGASLMALRKLHTPHIQPYTPLVLLATCPGVGCRGDTTDCPEPGHGCDPEKARWGNTGCWVQLLQVSQFDNNKRHSSLYDP